MRRPACAILLALAAGCGPSADPCAIATGGVSLAPSTLSQLNVQQSSVDCSGRADGLQLACAPGAEVTRSTCTDGFALTLDSGNVSLSIHFAQVDGSWQAGAKLAGGPTLASSSDLSIAGLGADPQPKAGTTQAGKFDFEIDQSKIDGQFTTTW